MIKIKNEEVIKAFGKKLRQLRISKGLSQKELASLTKIPLSQVGRIERGEINATLSTMNALSSALNISVSLLLKFD
ncbi:MAG: hypothetical protein JWR38_5244 [Mucilaginibacter sp.]|nr:hypothetical protein [Mucilaginibacter sp.]